MTASDYLVLLRERLTASYDVEAPLRLGDVSYPLYARSQVVAGKYFLHRSIIYERIELNEHVLCRVSTEPTTVEEVTNFVNELKRTVDELVKPSDEHMSSAITGVLIAESGFTGEAARKLSKSGFMRHFWLGLRGWCFLRLLGVDLSTGEVCANRRGKEVISAYSPG